jgi:Rrf2 family transcriptional regulator, cysteine metabolism repressor
MLDLAIHNTGAYIPLKDIAERQEISEKYLEQIIPSLTKAGYVSSTRGSQGGYMLARNPSEYTVGMIVRLLEGSLAPVACMESPSTCPQLGHCVTIEVWEKLKQAIDGVLDSITLEDLVSRYYEKSGSDFNI